MLYKHILEGMTPKQRQSTEAVIEHYRARVAELEKEKAELQKDRERLDWLDNNQRGVVAIDCEDERGTTFMGFTAAADWDGPEDGWHKSIRQAIDNARGEEG